MQLIKTTLLNTIAVGVRIITTLGLNKVLAVCVGPSGYAVIGQFQNFVAMITALASSSISTGVTKYTAEHFDDETRQIAIWRTAGTTALAGSLCLGFVIAILHRPLAVWVFKDETYASVFLWFGCCLSLFVANALLLAILNGKKEIKRFVTVNIASSLVGLVLTGGLATYWGLYGALLALAINQSVVFCVTLALCWRIPWFKLSRLVGRIDPAALRALGKFTLMALVSAVSAPLSQILIRNHMGATFGWNAAGHWEALVRISGLYLMVVTTPLSVYYLPRLAEIRNNTELKHEIYHGYRIILPLAAAGALTIYLLRDWLIITLLTAEFIPMRHLFAWQMAGDTVKIGSWLMAYVMIGRTMVRTFIVTELVFYATWVGWVLLLTRLFGVSGAQMGYFVNYAIYWLVMSVIIVRRIR